MQLTIGNYKTIALSSLGGALEFYDFVIFSFWAREISDLFFPTDLAILGLIKVYSVFAIGYLIRPFGGIVFSHYGDKYGRKKPFIITILLMSLATGGIGFLPTYNTIGIFAPILLIFFRLIQGFCVGGEIPGALTFVSEHVQSNRRGLTCALIFFGLNFGLVFGSTLNYIIVTLCTHEQIIAWGWRLSFIIGGILGLISLYLRTALSETPIFRVNSPKTDYVPVFDLLKFYRKETLQAIFITSLDAVNVCLLFLYLPTFLSTVLDYPKETVTRINTCAIFINAILFVTLGWLSDFIGRKKILLVGSFCIAFFSVGLFYLLSYQNLNYLYFVMTFFIIASACITSTYTSTLIELFPTRMRYTGMAISYNMGFAFFGGLSPLIATLLINFTGYNFSPSFYLSFVGLGCFLAALQLRKQTRQSLDFS